MYAFETVRAHQGPSPRPHQPLISGTWFDPGGSSTRPMNLCICASAFSRSGMAWASFFRRVDPLLRRRRRLRQPQQVLLEARPERLFGFRVAEPVLRAKAGLGGQRPELASASGLVVPRPLQQILRVLDVVPGHVRRRQGRAFAS